MRSAVVLSALLLSACEFRRPPMGEKIVVDVNGHRMTAQAFSQELAFRLKDQDALSAKDPKLVTVTKSRIVDDFVVQALTQDWAKDHGLVVKAEDLEEQIKKVQRSYPDDQAFQQALLEGGTTFKIWRERLQTTLLQKIVAQKLAESVIPLSESELQAYYQQHKSQFAAREMAQVRQILVTSESDARNIEDQLKKGKRMADLAKKYSVSPEAAEGGLVGWIEKGLTDVFEPAFRMKVGSRSPVVKSSFGYHIFEVAGRKPARGRTYQECKKEINSILLEKRQQDAYLAWLEEQIRLARTFKDSDFINAVRVETRIR